VQNQSRSFHALPTALRMNVLHGITPRASVCFSGESGNVIPVFSVLQSIDVTVILVLHITKV
jgi:hypothetical protein